MKQYHKIQTIFKRDSKGKIIIGDYSLPEFEYLKDNTWIFTEKVDGTSIRIMFTNAGLSFGGKTDNAQMPVPLLNKLQELFGGKELLFKEIFDRPVESGDVVNPQVCLYGEGYGAKIQKGGGNYIKDGVDFVLFDVKIGNWWLKRKDVEDIADKLEIAVVPIVGEGALNDAVELAGSGFKSAWGNFIAEGIVARPRVELQTRGGHRVITKIKHEDFK